MSGLCKKNSSLGFHLEKEFFLHNSDTLNSYIHLNRIAHQNCRTVLNLLKDQYPPASCNTNHAAPGKTAVSFIDHKNCVLHLNLVSLCTQKSGFRICSHGGGGIQFGTLWGAQRTIRTAVINSLQTSLGCFFLLTSISCKIGRASGRERVSVRV